MGLARSGPPSSVAKRRRSAARLNARRTRGSLNGATRVLNAVYTISGSGLMCTCPGNRALSPATPGSVSSVQSACPGLDLGGLAGQRCAEGPDDAIGGSGGLGGRRPFPEVRVAGEDDLAAGNVAGDHVRACTRNRIPAGIAGRDSGGTGAVNSKASLSRKSGSGAIRRKVTVPRGVVGYDAAVQVAELPGRARRPRPTIPSRKEAAVGLTSRTRSIAYRKSCARTGLPGRVAQPGPQREGVRPSRLR